MKLDSPLFDSIRVKPDQDRRLRSTCPGCDWPGCTAPATHRAPKGRDQEREYWRFCLDHVREYNQSYNFFSGMSDAAVANFQKDALTGHRPTWKMGSLGGKRSKKPMSGRFFHEFGGADDPFDLFRDVGTDRPHGSARAEAERRAVRNVERKAFETLGLETDAEKADIKARFKELVKRHHPDVNGGDRGSEDKLREIIAAYNHLKSSGRC
ncbi:J domain-containing protein [Xanthobacteraceae bacterium Astr-EGSB]|uniref:J domain-containing protein n=1 Tax=Astrobacterium formosum TaxID=3069710 RepID=UPI0027AE2B25|nr:J domain-containing protein [Xanthobacteraceae bacterium Astr-EGSB]